MPQAIWKDQVAVITGASSGLGKAIARHLAAQEVKLALFDLNEQALEGLKKEIGGDCQVFGLDITKEEAVQKAVDHVGEIF
ncbi:MAG TPA: SDR family NAD(P)-dependent oxidoreductase, partial [Puia sp.]|nr:SDR family NAD(P)-dependent oxidoreductase [Puia sp.]